MPPKVIKVNKEMETVVLRYSSYFVIRISNKIWSRETVNWLLNSFISHEDIANKGNSINVMTLRYETCSGPLSIADNDTTLPFTPMPPHEWLYITQFTINSSRAK